MTDPTPHETAAALSEAQKRAHHRTWGCDRPERSEAERAAIAIAESAHLPTPSHPGFMSEQDISALKAAFVRRFDEDLPRTETLFAVAMVGYRMALFDMEQRHD